MDLTLEMRMQMNNYKHMAQTSSMHHNTKQQVVSKLEMVNMGKLLILKESHIKVYGEVLIPIDLEGRYYHNILLNFILF